MQLRTLREVFAEPSQSGSVVLLSGEAGFGKTSLLSAALEWLDHRHRILVAACEPLVIPAAFSPLFEILDQLPTELQGDVRSGSGRMSVYSGMLDLIKNDRTVLVFEDVHWADEATLGLARYLGRRIGATDSTLILTFRSEELDLNPPLRLVVADLGPLASRLDLPPLSVEGVEQMVDGRGLDAGALHAATLGNPFFVEEVVRHPDADVPPTIQNAVLANSSFLPDAAQDVLNTVALSAEGLSTEDIGDLGDPTGHYVDLAYQRRLLVVQRGQVSCRHELIRQSLVQGMPPATKQRLHRRLLDHLEKRATDSPDIARLAYHSIGAEDHERAMTYSLTAGRDAAKAGAHRQAAFHYSNALEYDDVMDREGLNLTLLEAAVEHNFINDFDTARDLSARRLILCESPLATAMAQAWVAYFESRRNDLGAARRFAESAVTTLRQQQVNEELAVALSVIAWVELVEGHLAEAIELGGEGMLAAQASDSTGLAVYSATTVGTARWLLGDRRGFDMVEEAAAVGKASDAGEYAARAINSLGVISLWAGQLEEARDYFDELQEYATTHELDAWYIAAVATMSWVNVLTGRWDDADRDLETVAGLKTCFQTEIEVLDISARLRLRRGDPGVLELVNEETSRLEGFNDHDAQVTGCAVTMEAAWVGLLPSAQAEERYEALRRSPNTDGPGKALLGFWACRLGLDPPEGDILGAPGLELKGDLAGAAMKWERAGFVIEAAITQALAPGADLDVVFEDLTAMGADGVVRGLRRELQRRGVKGVPRGSRSSTRTNPGGLTTREVEVLELLVAGMSNSSIADELFISEKTAGHHVSSVLSKLNVSSRGQAAALAVANGWSEPVLAN